MKRNMIPLVAIAFVVAILSTAVFYGLFAGKLRSSGVETPVQRVVVAGRNLDRGTVLQAADLRVSELRSETKFESSLSRPEAAVGQTLIDPVQAGEPITLVRLGANAGSGVPKGMRAVSIRVADSAGITDMLRPGARVDIQAYSNRTGSVELKTILQNIEVSNVSPRGESREGGAASVVTVLIRPQDSDLIALADSGARIRVAVRNASDGEIVPARSLAMAALFHSGGRDSSAPPKTVRASLRAGKDENAVRLSVQALSVDADAAREIDSKLGAAVAGDSIHIVPFPAGVNTDELVRRLADKRQIEILSSSELTVTATQTATLNAGTDSGRLRLEFGCSADRRGRVSLRVRPDISWKKSEGVETRGFESEVPGGRAFVLSGLMRSQADRKLLEAIYPGRSWNGRELMILVSPRPSKLVHTAALTRGQRGR